MLQRCRNKKCAAWKDYGKRGIKVCTRWESFDSFYADMGPRPSSLHTLDRYPNQNGDYEPANCRWATREQQSRNRRSNRSITFNGRTQLLKDWAEETGLPRETIASRLRSGWSVKRTFTTPRADIPNLRKSGRRTKRSHLLTCNGVTRSVAEWSKRSGVHSAVLTWRIERGWSTRKAIFQPTMC